MADEIKENVDELVTAAKKVGKSVAKVGSEKGKTAAKKVKASATKIKDEVVDIFKNTKVETVIQVDGMEINEAELVERIKEDYKLTSEGTEVKSLNLYIKPADNAVYYVVNGVAAGKVDIR